MQHQARLGARRRARRRRRGRATGGPGTAREPTTLGGPGLARGGARPARPLRRGLAGARPRPAPTGRAASPGRASARGDAVNRSRGTLAGGIVLPAVAAATTWIAFYAWRGFSEEPAATSTRCSCSAVVGRHRHRPALVAGPRPAGRRWCRCSLGRGRDAAHHRARRCRSATRWAELRPRHQPGARQRPALRRSGAAQAPPIDALMILCGLLCLLLVDFLAARWHRVPLAGLPLLTIYSIPVEPGRQRHRLVGFAAPPPATCALPPGVRRRPRAGAGRSASIARPVDAISYGVGARVRRAARRHRRRRRHRPRRRPAGAHPDRGPHVFDFGPGSGGSDDSGSTTRSPTWSATLKAGDDTPLIRRDDQRPRPVVPPASSRRPASPTWSGARATGDVPRPTSAASRQPAATGGRRRPATPRTETAYEPHRAAGVPVDLAAHVDGRLPASVAEGDWRYDDNTMDFLRCPTT